MQLRLTNLLIAVIGTLALFTTSCKKEFSKDDPFEPDYTPTVFIGSQNQFLYAFDPVTGAKKWEYYAGANIQASPLVLNDKLFVVAENGFIHKLDAKTGSLIKKINIGGNLLSTPYGEQKGKDGNDYIYFGTGTKNTLYCYDATADTMEWEFTTGGNVYSSPTLYDTLVLFGSYDGKVYALDKEDGAKVWEFTTGGPVHSSPTTSASGYVMIGSNDNNMYWLHVNTGLMKWQFPTGGIVQSSPITFGGVTVFGSNDGYVYCVDDSSAIERWKIKTGDRIASSPYFWAKKDTASSLQLVFVGSYDYSMYAINILDGTVKWQYATKALIKSSPLVFEDKLYFGSHEKFLYCLDPATGDLFWKQNVNGLIESSPVVDNMDNRSRYTSSISGNSIY